MHIEHVNNYVILFSLQFEIMNSYVIYKNYIIIIYLD